jgi:hypothetical protein
MYFRCEISYAYPMRLKLTTVALFVAVALPSAAQSLLDLQPAPGVYVNGVKPEDGALHLRELVIWTEDFANGIPETWTLESNPEAATWEYRGPSTNPSSTAGTRGSCVSAGDQFGPPIESETADNGFIIFDSNYWDDNLGPCGNFGVGPAPGPHQSSITTATIDLSDFESVGLRFNQYCKNFQAETRIEYSIAGGEWQVLWVNDVPVNSGESSKNRVDRLNVSPQLGGQSEVRLRFVFDGNYYFWMLDDIEFFELLQNNLYMESATYGDLDMTDMSHVTGFEDMEYSLYPAEMAPLLHFQASTWNWGSQQQTGCQLNIDLRNETTGDTIHSASSNITSLNFDQQYTFATPTYQLGDEQAPYSVHFQVSQTQEEESPENNHMIRNFVVSDVVYARDQLSTEGIFVPNPAYNGSPYEVGNFFVITRENQAVESISIGIGQGSDPFADVYARIYKLNVTSQGISAETIAETDEFGITADAFNNVGDNNIMTIPFPQAVALDKDSAYLVVAGTNAGPENVFFPISGDSPDLTSMVRFYPNSWFFLVRTPLVRMNFGPVVGVLERDKKELEFSCYPNPANAVLNINYSLTDNAFTDIQIYDQVGKVVLRESLGRLSTGNYQQTLDISSLNAGWYVVSMQSGDVRKNEMVIIQK